MSKALTVLAISLAAVSFTSCDDNEGSKTKPFESELIGYYTPRAQQTDTESVSESTPVVYGDIFITPTWKDPNNVPTIDMSAIFGQPVSIDMMLMLTSSMIPMLYAGGLDHFEFKNDGTFAFGYRELVDFLEMKFSETVGKFPSPETEQLVPTGAITYYTEGGKLYFAVNKMYLTQIGNSQLGMDLTELIDTMIKEYNLSGSVVSTKEKFALPLKYTLADNVLTIKVDLEMMKPFLPLIQSLLPLLPEEAEFDMGGGPATIPARKVVGELVDGLLNQTTALEIGIRLDKKR